ncbi:ANTAR domain-containing protein [Kribbella turkmenica]|uniref:ANTAR domain-containing protein n=1 Tax=Kribbella turkmenica TaxID=2530375 RepID=A0A4R4WG63_9ACTN|nr:ANTAR domain-containing protein [Kribbella turkmenica]TDD17989.1 ANTAR domain-containing protein [Kribbella turkmenica]
MGNDDEDFGALDPGRVDEAATFSIAVAQGVLIERYDLSADGALTMLDGRARSAGIPIVEAARWLLSAGSLP